MCYSDVVVDASQVFHFPGTVVVEQGVIDDEGVPPNLARQWCDSLLFDSRVQAQRELAPMDGAEIQETVDCVPLEWDGLRRILIQNGDIGDSLCYFYLRITAEDKSAG